MPTPSDIDAERSAQAALASRLKFAARDLGFDLVGITSAASPLTLTSFETWLDRGFAGEMSYLEDRKDAYAHPEGVLPGVKSIILLAMNYNSGETFDVSEREDVSPSSAFRVSRYAWGERDYHDLIRERMRSLAEEVHKLQPGCRTRGIVDTAPLLERDFARQAGLGWFGKNTMLINKRAGSWLFLSALLTDLDLSADVPHETAHCGTCTACLDVCPTNAFDAPYVLDARKCISYLTIELRNEPVPEELREGLGNWLFGCDECQDVCPWNRKSPKSNEPAFQKSWRFNEAELIELLSLSETQFRERFRGTPLLRTGRDAILRNACYVLGNRLREGYANDETAIRTALSRAAIDASLLVSKAAEWALRQMKLT